MRLTRPKNHLVPVCFIRYAISPEHKSTERNERIIMLFNADAFEYLCVFVECKGCGIKTHGKAYTASIYTVLSCKYTFITRTEWDENTDRIFCSPTAQQQQQQQQCYAHVEVYEFMHKDVILLFLLFLTRCPRPRALAYICIRTYL